MTRPMNPLGKAARQGKGKGKGKARRAGGQGQGQQQGGGQQGQATVMTPATRPAANAARDVTAARVLAFIGVPRDAGTCHPHDKPPHGPWSAPPAPYRPGRCHVLISAGCVSAAVRAERHGRHDGTGVLPMPLQHLKACLTW